jgi:hypothetical protein
MEGDSKKKKTVKKMQRSFADASDVLSAFWVRLPFQIDNGSNWFLLGSRSSFLWCFRMLLAILYIVIKTFE